MTWWSRTLAAGSLCGLVLLQGAAGPSLHRPMPTGDTARVDSTWLNWDPATRTVRFKLIAGLTGQVKSPFNFNGFVDGELTISVPESSTVVLDFQNQDGTPHSAVVIEGSGPIPNMAENPAIPRAYTRKAAEGMGYYEKDTVRFRATPQGEYRIFCGVPGHGLSGMWIRLNIVSGLAAPTVGPTPVDSAKKG